MCRITADFAGTPDDPVVVTSAFHERVVGVPDPEDDCVVVWSLIKSDEPPKQIIPGGEYFVLKHIEPEPWASLPESASPLTCVRQSLVSAGLVGQHVCRRGACLWQ